MEEVPGGIVVYFNVLAENDTVFGCSPFIIDGQSESLAVLVARVMLRLVANGAERLHVNIFNKMCFLFDKNLSGKSDEREVKFCKIQESLPPS